MAIRGTWSGATSIGPPQPWLKRLPASAGKVATARRRIAASTARSWSVRRPSRAPQAIRPAAAGRALSAPPPPPAPPAAPPAGPAEGDAPVGRGAQVVQERPGVADRL